MNSIQAIDYALHALRAKRARLETAGNLPAVEQASDAIYTLEALRVVIVESERATRAALKRR